MVRYIFYSVQAISYLGQQPDGLYSLIMHEIIHALGFSDKLFDK